jgi:hypothetical protein
MMAFVSCLEESVAGKVDVDQGMENHGLPWIQAGIETSDDEATENANLAIFERCFAVEASLVSDLYVSQPSAVAWYAEHFEEYRDEIVACLADEGHPPPDGATTDEILALDNELNIDAPQRTACVISSGMAGSTIVRVN